MYNTRMETEQNGFIRGEDGRFVNGTAPGPGRSPETPEEKVAKKAARELIEEYKESLAQVLPEISPVLKNKAKEGDIQAIKEIHDRVMGKAKETKQVQGDKENPLSVIVVPQEVYERETNEVAKPSSEGQS